MIDTQTDPQTDPATEPQEAPEYPIQVNAGERPLLFTHRQYLAARRAKAPLAEYDILMRRPDLETPQSEAERWRPVPALKYLKHRAEEWTEASSIDDVPDHFRDHAQLVGDHWPLG